MQSTFIRNRHILDDYDVSAWQPNHWRLFFLFEAAREDKLFLSWTKTPRKVDPAHEREMRKMLSHNKTLRGGEAEQLPTLSNRTYLSFQ